MEPSAAFLHDGAVYCNKAQSTVPHMHVQLQDICSRGLHNSLTNEFERPPLFDQMSQRILHYAGRPLVDFTVVVVGTTDDTLDALRRSKTTQVRDSKTQMIFCVNVNIPL